MRGWVGDEGNVRRWNKDVLYPHNSSSKVFHFSPCSFMSWFNVDEEAYLSYSFSVVTECWFVRVLDSFKTTRVLSIAVCVGLGLVTAR